MRVNGAVEDGVNVLSKLEESEFQSKADGNDDYQSLRGGDEFEMERVSRELREEKQEEDKGSQRVDGEVDDEFEDSSFWGEGGGRPHPQWRCVVGAIQEAIFETLLFTTNHYPFLRRSQPRLDALEDVMYEVRPVSLLSFSLSLSS